MAEKKLAAESPVAAVREISQKLLEMGVKNAEYYVYAEGRTPYFCVPKAFKKEEADDPDNEYLFVDVDEHEVSVYGQYIHEHFSNPAFALMLVEGLLSGAIAEVGLVLQGAIVGFFAKNTKDPEQNIKIVEKNAEKLVNDLHSPLIGAGIGHMHQYLHDAVPYNAFYGPYTQPMPDGCRAFFFSSVLGEHAEIYCVA